MDYLVGEKIQLTKFTERFRTAKYVSWLNDQSVNRYLCTGRIPITAEELGNRNDYCNIMFAMMSSLEYDEEAGHFVQLEEFPHYIGTISLNAIDWISRNGEIGYMIGDKRYWGAGIASEAVQLVSDYALHRLNLNKVEAGVVAGNIGSVKVLEKNGFKQYGTIPEHYWLEGKYHDVHRFYKLQAW